VWPDKKYKYRFGISYLENRGGILPPATIRDDLSFIKNKEKWSIYFRGGVISIPIEDFEIIKSGLISSITHFTEIESIDVSREKDKMSI